LEGFVVVWWCKHRTVDAWRTTTNMRYHVVVSHIVLLLLRHSSTWAFPVSPQRTSRLPLSASPLSDVVCLVTGASRGIGKGIALELGAQGAIVYVTGSNRTDGSIAATAEQVTRLGGLGIPVVCDSSNDTQIEHLMQRIDADYGYLDILVNNAFRIAYPDHGNKLEFLMRQPFWQQGALAWDSIHAVGLRNHYITTCLAMQLLFRARERKPNNLPRPLIVMISSFGGLTYTFNVAYGVGKAGVDRMVKDMAVELQRQDVCIVSLWPGVVQTEGTLASVENGDWAKYMNISMDMAETPRFTGRAVVALAADSRNHEKSGTVQVVAELATEYGWTDVDGSVPPSIRSLRFLLYNYALSDGLRKWVSPSMIPDWRLPFWMMASGRIPESND
jgi:dehydrogenase/reductase SDR family member 1